MGTTRIRLTFSIWAATALFVTACTSVQSAPTPPVSVPVTPLGSAAAGSLIPGVSLAPGTSDNPTFVPATTNPTTGTTKTPKPPKTPKPSASTTPPTTPPTNNPGSWPTGAIAATDAASHIGETLTVCGTVDSANWVYADPGHPTWLNFGGSYPNQKFNAVIWGEQRRQWPLSGKPEVVYLNHEICVTGQIQSYKTWVQIQDLQMSDIQVIS